MTIYAENILVCIAAPLLVALLFIHDNARRVIASFLVGMGVCLLAAYINSFVNLASGFGAEDTAVFLAPIVEEIMKFLPVLFYMLVFSEWGKNLFTAAVGIGAGFATFENCCYILSAGADRFTYVLIRGMAVGVMHIVSIFALTIGLAVAKRLKVLTLPAAVGALSLAMTFHALYNLLVSGKGLFAVAGYALPILASLLLYTLYRRLRTLEITGTEEN